MGKRIFLFCLFCFLFFIKYSFATDKFIVYFFYTKPATGNIVKIERFTKDVLRTKIVKNVTIAYKAIDLDNPNNKRFFDDFNTYDKTLLIATDNSKYYKKFDDIWVLLKDEEEFKKYLTRQIKFFIKYIR